MTQGVRFLAIRATPASCVLTAAGVICLLVFSYLVYYYAWTGQRRFTNPAGAAIYYALPALLATAFFASLRLTASYRIVAAVIGFLLVTLAYGSEMFLHLSDSTRYVPQKPFMAFPAKERKEIAVKLAKQFGVSIDTRDPDDVIADFRKQGIRAVRQVALPLFERNKASRADSNEYVELIPFGGIANRMTVACNQNGEYLTYESDQHGFHNPNGIWNSTRIDIVAVGNSFTLGYCVPSDKSFVALVRHRYPSTLNLGMTGEGPLHILAVLKEYAQVFKPKLVLWFYSEENSLAELQVERQSPSLLRYLQDDFTQRLVDRRSELDQALMGYMAKENTLELSRPSREPTRQGEFTNKVLGFIKLSALRQRLGVVYGATAQQPKGLYESELATLEADLNLFRDILTKAKLHVGTWGGELYFVYLTSWDRYESQRMPGVKARANILSFVSALGIPLIDTTTAFATHPDPLSLFPFRGPGHYNEKGHRLVAQEVLRSISLGN